MSTTSKIVTGIIVLVAIVGGVMYSMGNKVPASPTVVTNTSTDYSTTASNTSGSTLITSPSDSSTAALTADMSSIDASISTVETNSAQTDASFNDQPVAQTE